MKTGIFGFSMGLSLGIFVGLGISDFIDSMQKNINSIEPKKEVVVVKQPDCSNENSRIANMMTYIEELEKAKKEDYDLLVMCHSQLDAMKSQNEAAEATCEEKEESPSVHEDEQLEPETEVSPSDEENLETEAVREPEEWNQEVEAMPTPAARVPNSVHYSKVKTNIYGIK